MYIDLDNAVSKFKIYTKQFDTKDKNIDRKIYHSIRVMKVSKDIATRLNLTQEKIEIASIIGLLHDIGRFDQYKIHQTYRDLESFDQGDYGVEILKNNIRNYVKTDKYDDLIFKAIKNHNKFAIEEGLNSEELLFAKIIRDADKTDILYESANIFFKGDEEDVNSSTVADEVFDEVMNKKLVKRKKGRRIDYIDNVISVMAMVFDINFKETFQIINEKNYVIDTLKRYHLKDDVSEKRLRIIEKFVSDYIFKKCKES